MIQIIRRYKANDQKLPFFHDDILFSRRKWLWKWTARLSLKGKNKKKRRKKKTHTRHETAECVLLEEYTAVHFRGRLFFFFFFPPFFFREWWCCSSVQNERKRFVLRWEGKKTTRTRLSRRRRRPPPPPPPGPARKTPLRFITVKCLIPTVSIKCLINIEETTRTVVRGFQKYKFNGTLILWKFRVLRGKILWLMSNSNKSCTCRTEKRKGLEGNVGTVHYLFADFFGGWA